MDSDILKHFDLTGKVAAITGGGGELCGAMTEALGAVGVKVAVLDIKVEKAEARSLRVIQSGGEAKAFQCNVLDVFQVRECYEAVCNLWGPPDFLINGAGGNDPRGARLKNSTALPDHPVRRPSLFSIWIRPGSARCLTSISWGRFS